jgi:hypothetical protein
MIGCTRQAQRFRGQIDFAKDNATKFTRNGMSTSQALSSGPQHIWAHPIKDSDNGL